MIDNRSLSEWYCLFVVSAVNYDLLKIDLWMYAPMYVSRPDMMVVKNDASYTPGANGTALSHSKCASRLKRKMSSKMSGLSSICVAGRSSHVFLLKIH